MFRYEKVGSLELIEQVEMPASTKQVIIEVLKQNRMIAEANCSIINLLSKPMQVIAKPKKP